MIEIGRVPAALLPAVWKDVWRIVNRFGEKWLEENDLDEEDLFKLFLTQYDLWLATDGPILEGVLIASKGTDNSYYLLWAGGVELKKYLHQGVALLLQYALWCGFDEVKVNKPRKGWKRVLELKDEQLVKRN